MDGLIIIDKGEGITSFSAVARVRRLFGVSKAGHTGTLDPLATGVLPVLIGRAVKASEFMLTADKHYIATLTLGVATDTEDITGNITDKSDSIPEEGEVLSVISSFVGVSMQTPPMYSALKVGGKKLCDLARAGKTVEREAREICVHSISAKRLTDRDYMLDVVCSKGTYIRTLCADIGRALGCFGTMKTLRRAESAGFTLDDAYTLDELEAMSEAERAGLIIPTEQIFKKYPAVTLSPFFARLAHSGLEIYLKKIGLDGAAGDRVRLLDADGFFALGEIREYEAGLAIKPIRQFLV